MPARPSHRLDIHLVPEDRSEQAVEQVQALWAEWERTGVHVAGAPGPAADSLVEGGFARVRRDDPGQVVLYANQVGGFQVHCPSCQAGLARELRPFDLTVCPACAGAFDFDTLDIRPAASLGRASLVLVEVEAAEISNVPAGFRVVLRRVG